MTKALLDVFTERQRQIDAEGWTPAHDDSHNAGELAAAGASYAAIAEDQQADRRLLDAGPPAFWPFGDFWWKPSEEPRRNLVKAAALILAEIDRLDRVASAAQPPTESDECWSTNEEEYRWESLSELIEENEDIKAGDTIYQGTPDRPNPAGYIYDAGDCLEKMAEQAYDDIGEFAEDYPDPSDESKSLLDSLLKAWAREHCRPHFYKVANVREYVIQPADMEGR